TGPRPQFLAERRDLDGYVAFFNRDARPDLLEDFGLGDGLAARLQHRLEQPQAALADGHDLAVAPQFLAGRQYKRTKTMQLCCHGRDYTWNAATFECLSPKAKPRDLGSRGFAVRRNFADELCDAGFGEDFALVGFAQHVAAAPDSFDVVLAAG